MMPRMIAYCLLCGLVMIASALGVGAPQWHYVAGVVFSAAFVPIVMRGPERTGTRFLVIWPAVLIITAFCTWTEAVIFVRNAPGLTALAGSVAIYTVMAAVLAFAAVLLKLVRPDPGIAPRLHRPVRLVGGILLAGVAYMVYYLVFGGIFYQLLTKPYYTGTGPLADAQALAMRIGAWLFAIQIGRGALMTAAIVPLVARLRMSRRAAAVTVGMLVWVIGGLALLIPPNPVMPVQLRAYHIGEIFTQNFLLGVTAVLLVRCADTTTGRSEASTAAAAD